MHWYHIETYDDLFLSYDNKCKACWYPASDFNHSPYAFTNKRDADSVCRKLNKRGIDCKVVKYS